MDEITVEETVSNGIAWIEQTFGRPWRDAVPRPVNVKSHSACPLGQAAGLPFYHAVRQFSLPERFLSDHGFTAAYPAPYTANGHTSWAQRWNELQAEWTRRQTETT